MFVRCPFCHRLILQWLYERHERNHTRRKADGQMNEHITVAPDERYDGSLSKVPRNYRHPRCGRGTGMPEEIIRSYLANPLLYSDSSFCTGCGEYIYCGELFWIETGESLMDYNGRLRAEYLQRAYGLSPASQRKQVVVVTPPAEQAIRRTASERGQTTPYTFVLQRGKTKLPSDYASYIMDKWDPRIYAVVLDGDDLQVVVPKAQIESLRGTIIHYVEGPKKGYTMRRLYAARPDA
jgi:hypothetical protein